MPIIDFWTTNLNPITLLGDVLKINKNFERPCKSIQESVIDDVDLSTSSDFCMVKKCIINNNFELFKTIKDANN